MDNHVIVIGGGVAGLEAAGRLSQAGIKVSIVEKDNITGGHINNWYKLFPDRKESRMVKDYLDLLTIHKGITLMTNTSIEKIEKHNGSFHFITKEGRLLTGDAVIVATGFDLFRSSRKEEYGYGIYDNVYTSADLEKMFRNGSIVNHNGNPPESVGLVHCVGSRDEKVGNLYCSKLCCVTAVKQAIEIKEHLPSCRVYCYYMDMRMGGAHYEELYREAQEKWGISFIRGKVSEAGETIDNKVIIKVEDTLIGRPLRMELDMLILMAGMEMSEGGRKIADLTGLATGENRFFSTVDDHFGSNLSSHEGIFFAGTCTAPMNITETISHARAAVTEVVEYLKTRN